LNPERPRLGSCPTTLSPGRAKAPQPRPCAELLLDCQSPNRVAYESAPLPNISRATQVTMLVTFALAFGGPPRTAAKSNRRPSQCSAHGCECCARVGSSLQLALMEGVPVPAILGDQRECTRSPHRVVVAAHNPQGEAAANQRPAQGPSRSPTVAPVGRGTGPGAPGPDGRERTAVRFGPPRCTASAPRPRHQRP
jgi:hypothetical protein